MGTKLRRITLLGVVLLPTLVVTACLNAEPKILGRQSPLDFGDFTGSGLSGSFNFNFALSTAVKLNSATTTTPVVQFQGATNAQSSITGTCNLNGTSCQCNFYASNQTTLLGTTNSSQITYDQPGNYITCTIPGTVTQSSIAYATVGSLDSSVLSKMMPVNTTLTMSQLIGSDLDAKKVRTVSRYACQYNYLQKDGTSAAGFSCTAGATSCTGTAGGPTFCIAAARVPFYIYADTFSNNASSKIADRIYAGSGGSNLLCGLQVKQINCVADDQNPSDAFGTPVKAFGLYNEATGIWQNGISLPSGPDQTSANVGFAAATSLVTTTLGNCPPGLDKRIFYTVAVTSTMAAGPGTASVPVPPPTNAPGTQTLTEVADPASPPANFALTHYAGGSCNGSTCVLPSINTGAYNSTAYSSSTFTPFCVIPSGLLP